MSEEFTDQVEDRAREILGGDDGKLYDTEVALDLDFIRDCFKANERGDGLLLAALIRDHFLYVNDPDGNGEWFFWEGQVWQKDEDHTLYNVADCVAQAYEDFAWDVELQRNTVIEEATEEREEAIAKIKQDNNEDSAEKLIDKLLKKELPVPKWMATTMKNYSSRAYALRSIQRITKAMFIAPKVDLSITTRANFLDQKANLLPAKNGVIDLDRGIIVPGRPDDLLTQRIDISYDPKVDYTPWVEILKDICIHPKWEGSEELPHFLQKFFGYCCSGYTSEEIITVFYGPGRNGKGTIIEPITKALGPFFHKANRSLFIEQKYEPSPSAASEHMYAMKGKRLVVGAETNKGQNIDGGRIKDLTGGNEINFRKNFGSENHYTATHKLILETNNIPPGLTKEFSLKERLVLIDFYWRFVHDIEESEKQKPALKGRFKKKDTKLKQKLKTPEYQIMILRWLVDGYQLWKKEGLDVPACCKQSSHDLEKNENTLQRFTEEVLIQIPLNEDGSGDRRRIPLGKLYDIAFKWWWGENMDGAAKMTHKNTLSTYLSENGFDKDKKGGTIYIFQVDIHPDIKKSHEDFQGLAESYIHR
ncbi:MAG: hypothetical protein COA36_11650 [Desulfotalea sp.]|nr:MAG: hypothetical protein COA36_11650 [Desulfotalea sp.]